MNKTRHVSCSALVWLLVVAATWAGLSSPASGQAADARLLREEGFALARDGKFARALETLEKADARLDDQTVSDAVVLLKSYLADRKAHERQRLEEYYQAVQRVWRSMMALDAFPTLAGAGLEEKLRDKVMEGVGDAQGNAGTAVSLQRAELSSLEALQSDTRKALTDAEKALDEALSLLEGRKSEYAATFRKLAAAYRENLQAYRKAWADVQAGSRAELESQSKRLTPLEQSLVESLGDLEAMISKDTWRVMLGQARLARELAPETVQVEQQEWFTKTVAKTKAFAAEARADARWYDVLAAWSGLKELDPDNETYKDLEHLARAHARVVRIYGREEEESAFEVEQRWKEYTEGIDARMVEDTIDSVARVYVTSIDFREMLGGALDAVQILAETPQVWKTFPDLADRSKRDAFLERVDKIREHYGKRDDVSYLHLQLAMNAVLQASDRSVKLPTAVLAREYCDGMLDKLDRFSSMIWPSEYTDFRKSTLGRFGGVGIQISKEPGEPLRVVTPLYGSPAFEAGIKAGDLIVAVEGKETNEHDLDKLVNMISGPVGTKVTLRIRRPGVIKPFDVKVERAEIRIKTVKGWRRTNARGDWEYRIDPADKIGYIRLTQFTDKTHEDMVQALRKLRSRGIDSVILDLRFNPGGLLVSAQEVSNEFLKGGLIVKTRGRRQKDERRANSSGTFLDGNLVVLVNEFSASAAEIVSGALKDWKRCIVVGDRSYGKGSVQNVIPIRYRKAMLKLTTAYYYLPTGRLLHRKNGSKTWGVDPDVEVQMTPKQMRSWLDIRSETDLIVDENRGLDKELAQQFNADMQLKTAVLLVKLQQLQSGDTSVRAVLKDSREDK